MAALAEDLLLAGDYESALAVVDRAPGRRRRTPSAVASQGSRVALDGVVGTAAFVETAELLGDMAESEAAVFADICAVHRPRRDRRAEGRTSSAEAETPGRTRATAIIARYGARARRPARVAGRIEQVGGAAQRRGAARARSARRKQCRCCSRCCAARIRASTTAAVRALSNINDPAAARAVHTVLRAATGDQRRAVVDALVAQRDARVVPLLVRILDESDPFGADHADRARHARRAGAASATTRRCRR